MALVQPDLSWWLSLAHFNPIFFKADIRVFQGSKVDVKANFKKCFMHVSMKCQEGEEHFKTIQRKSYSMRTLHSWSKKIPTLGIHVIEAYTRGAKNIFFSVIPV